MATALQELMFAQDADKRRAFDERRMAIVRVSPEVIVNLATGLRVEIDKNDVPPWCLVAHPVKYNAERACFDVIVVDISLEPVPDGEPLPILQGPIYRRVEDAT